MRYDILYKRTKTGAIQYYKVTVEEGDIDHTPSIVKESGQLGTTNPVFHREAIFEGKNIGKANETTPLAQAKSQAFSDWKKKKDEGYKSKEDLGIPSMITESDPLLLEALQRGLPQFNTDAAGNVKPMLAKDWNKGKGVKFPCYIQPKLDGVRCLMVVLTELTNPGIKWTIKFLSRSGKSYDTLEHIAKDLVPHINKIRPQSFILDGEIYSDELSFQEIVAAVKKQRPDSLKLHFRAYDIVNESNQKDRMWEAKLLVEKIRSPFIHFVDTRHVQDLDEVKTFHDEFVQAGYEGAMLRLFDGIYGQGQRSSHLLKVKEFDEAEFEFVRWEQGQREEDLLAVLYHWPNGKDQPVQAFRAKMIGNRLEKQVMVEQKPKVVTIKHFGWTNDGLPRFPIGKSIRDYD